METFHINTTTVEGGVTMKLKRILAMICVLAMGVSLLAGCGKAKTGETTTTATTATEATTKAGDTASAETDLRSTPRNETLYVNGLLWGVPTNFNMLTGNSVFPVAWNVGSGFELVYESLFMLDQLTGENNPLIGSSYDWVDDLTLEIKLNPDVKFSDGIACTADDVVYSYKLAEKYAISWSSYWTYIQDVTAKDPTTVIIALKPENPNKLSILESLGCVPIHPKHIWEVIEKDNKDDITAIRAVFNEDPIGTGPYKVYFHDDSKVTVARDDNYWGQKLFGGLAAPKYITHNIFKDNSAGTVAFESGEVDISQQFIPQVWTLWEDGTPIRCYLKDLPYYVPATMPSLIFNVNKPGLDNADVRKAIAMSIDYDKVAELAMSGYSDKISPAITLASGPESELTDWDAIKELQWTYDVDGANALLDSIGAAKGADGIRVLNGERLGPWMVSCPYGWSDWNATLEIVAQCSTKIGIEIQTEFPEFQVWYNNFLTGQFDMGMWGAGGLSAAQPWAKARQLMYSKDLAPVGEQAFFNQGRYSNDRANEIVDLIPVTSDAAELKALYTELTKIWLTDVPSAPLMYRPAQFYTINESIWTNFPVEGDSSGVGPQICMTGNGIKGLYQLKLK